MTQTEGATHTQGRLPKSNASIVDKTVQFYHKNGRVSIVALFVNLLSGPESLTLSGPESLIL